MESRTLVTGLIKNTYDSVIDTSFGITDHPKSEIESVEFPSITAFWEQVSNLVPMTPIVLTGQLSLFGPAVPGIPIGKRELHLETRRNLNDIEKDLTENDYPVGPTTLDAILSFSAGQMVIRPQGTMESPYVYLGLYQSIVRNSIPLFVRRDYFESKIAPYFGTNKTTIEARVAGYAVKTNKFGRNFEALLKEFGIYKLYDPSIVKKLNEYILQVDGDDDLSRIEYVSESRYLDGDIWIALRTGGVDRIVSRFLDISDWNDLKNERAHLLDDIKNNYKDGKIISEYDQVNRLTKVNQIIDPMSIFHSHPNKPKSVFISYNHSNRDVAIKVKNALEKNGIKVLIDYEIMDAGENISEFIQNSIQTTDVTLSIVSNNSLLSSWVGMETTLTFYQEKLQNKKKFIACYLDDDFFQTDFRLEATKKIDEQISKIDAKIPEYTKLKIDTNDLNDEKSRLHKLRSDLGEYLQRLRETLTLDIRDESFDQSIVDIINTIKNSK